MTTRLLLTVVVVAQCTAPVWAGYDEGIAAYDRGDYATALQEWQPLADQGDTFSQTGLGELYRDGKGVPQDYRKALLWYQVAALQDLAIAQTKLGSLYLNGLGVPQDYAEALRWLRLAAAQGEPVAEGKLAVMFAEGLGVPQDYVYAHMWANLSSAAGEKQMAKFRDALAQHMTPAQIAEAQRFAREWKPVRNTQAPTENPSPAPPHKHTAPPTQPSWVDTHTDHSSI
jgi:uncharacterized protein